ncbi:hypothetical protein D9613_011712 [Agrocybe pediades]|uniref:Uncharacterized protein n=1 Tax=Agrocybe pediades TaxID=84607 RepID=A0A8H4QKU3_9AGAR|nr:hypothetical protein D9613_011712 [Agrocybe pediades]
MFLLRPHERHDLRNKSITKSLTTHLTLFIISASAVGATPVQLSNRDNSSNDGQPAPLSTKIWVPILVLMIALFSLGMLAWRRYSSSQSRSLFPFRNRRRTATTTNPAAPREITAEQLAGTINGENTTANAPTRRTRRPRRTPSQMSVTSLPAYNKEPGEEELVIFRGQDAEDATTMPTARAIMTSMDEEREEEERYSPMPTSPNSTPLLQDDDAQGDLSMQALPLPPGEDMPRPSYDTGSGSNETSSLMQVGSGTPDPRGETPSYDEAVNQSQAHLNPTSEAAPSPPAAAPAHAQTPSSPGNNRRSGFRTLLNRMSMAGHPQPGHNRNESTASNLSSNISHGHDGQGTLHRSTPSGSGSLLSVSMFRTLSRQRSTHTLNSNRLNSPSLISLNSISSPLTHTLTRTEFTYPKSGPTPEQLKVISSRDTFARFGVPYGPDAVAFAASSSRQDLMIPPPDFEEVTGSEASSSRSPESATPSRLRSSSNAAQLAEASSSANSASTSGLSGTPANTDNAPVENTATPETEITSPVAPNTSPADAPVPAQPSQSSISKNHDSIASSKSTQKKDFDDDVSEFGKLTAAAPASNVNPTGGASISSSKSTTNKPAINDTVSEFGKLSAPPPSSYHDATGGSSVRSESRASVFSYQSYATAAESVAPSMANTYKSARRAHARASLSSNFSIADGTEGEETEYESQPATPTTPRLGGQHQLEGTDATVVVSRNDKRDTITPSTTGASSGAQHQ